MCRPQSTRPSSWTLLAAAAEARLPVWYPLSFGKSGALTSAPVQYRGIFLNDEQPSLQNWAQEKFASAGVGSLTASPFNHVFYGKLCVALTLPFPL
jgi:hypothetical protein